MASRLPDGTQIAFKVMCPGGLASLDYKNVMLNSKSINLKRPTLRSSTIYRIIEDIIFSAKDKYQYAYS